MFNIFVHSAIAFTISKYATMVGNDCESERNKIPPFFFSYEGKHLLKSPSACLKALYFLPTLFVCFWKGSTSLNVLKPTIRTALRFMHSRSAGF